MWAARDGGSYLQAGVVQELSIKLDLRKLLRDLTGSAQEQTVGHLHDSGLVYGADLLPADRLRMLERES